MLVTLRSIFVTFICIYHLSDITVQFNQTVYSVSEGEGEVVVYILVEGRSDKLLQFHLEAVDDSTSCEFLRLHKLFKLSSFVLSW